MSAVPAPPVLPEPRPARPMADVIDHLADLTGNRDRERVDVVFVQALVALLRAQEVAVWRLVGEGQEWRWFLCARLRAGEVTPASDAPWTPFADLVLPDRHLDARSLIRLVEDLRPTLAGAVPTIWNDVLHRLEEEPDHDMSSLRLVVCGGSAVPVSLMRTFEEKHGVQIRQLWGMTETSPMATMAWPPPASSRP